MAKTALVYNLIPPHMLQSGPLDRIAEYDSEETILALSDAIRAGGHQVVPLEADESIAEKLMSVRPQIVFNIAEGIRGESRESHVPAICEMLGLPYTGSGPLTLAPCLNKARAKEILSYYHILTPPFQVFRSPEDRLDSNLRFPLITKLLHEGASMGLSEHSIVEDEVSLKHQVKYLIKTYHITQTALRAFRVLGCRDWCRMEMRLGHDGTLYVLELNPIAGIDPSYWLPKAAEVAGLSYEDLVNEILDCALVRAGLKVHALRRPASYAWATVPMGAE